MKIDLPEIDVYSIPIPKNERIRKTIHALGAFFSIPLLLDKNFSLYMIAIGFVFYTLVAVTKQPKFLYSLHRHKKDRGTLMYFAGLAIPTIIFSTPVAVTSIIFLTVGDSMNKVLNIWFTNEFHARLFNGIIAMVPIAIMYPIFAFPAFVGTIMAQEVKQANDNLTIPILVGLLCSLMEIIT